MKSFIAVVVVLLCIAFAGACMAAESDHLSTKQKIVDRNGDTKIDGVDIYDESGKVVKRGYDIDGDRYVDSWETYDTHTGMPIVTESDKAFELR